MSLNAAINFLSLNGSGEMQGNQQRNLLFEPQPLLTLMQKHTTGESIRLGETVSQLGTP